MNVSEENKGVLSNILCFLLIMFYLLSFSSDVLNAKTRNPEIYVFGSRSFAPFIFLNDQNEPVGFLLDILSSARSSQGSLKIELGSWAGLENERRNRDRKTDLIMGISFSRASSEILDHNEFLINTAKPGFTIERFLSKSSQFISGKDLNRFWFYIPVDDVSFTFFAPKENAKNISVKDVFGKHIVVRRGSEGHHYLQEHSQVYRIIVTESDAEALYMVLSGEADYALLGTYQGQYLVDRLNLKDILPLEESLFTRNQGFVVTRGNVSLASELIRGLERIRQQGIFDQIYNKWFNSYKKRTIDLSLTLKIIFAAIAVLLLFLLWSFSLKKQVNRIIREREKIVDFTRDGIVAVDKEGKISLLNRTAIELTGLKGYEKGQDIDQCIPELGLSDVLRNGETVHDYEQNVGGRILVTNKAPVKVGEEVVGAIATFRDMTEIRSMAQEMTGVKMYVESLRVQNHEFLNKLQAISGLIQLGKYSKAIDFISSEHQEWQSITSFVSEHIENFVVGGILVGKIGRCRELGIDFVIDPDSTCCENTSVGDQILVTVIGNLLENAIEVLRDHNSKKPVIEFAVFDESGQIMISVRDNGKGIDDNIRDKIFEKGFSTKKCGKSCGYGLYSIKMMVEALKGDLFLDSVPGEYTEFVITIPNGGV